MNKKHIINSIWIAFAFAFVFTSCVDDLNTEPLDENTKTADNVLTGEDSYKGLLAKCYAGYLVGGQKASDGDQDISSINGSFSSYLRLLWNHQELTTDEAICAWNDGNLRDLHDMDWTSSNEFVTAMYYRITLQITYCNNLIKLTEGKDEYVVYRNEARMLRALSYWHMLDMFGRGPFVTDKDAIGSFFFPEMATQQKLYDYIETELKDLETVLAEPRSNEYGRVDKATAWMVLSKLYLNAEVYIQTPKYTECLTYCNKVIAAGYSTEPTYANLFLADNHLRTNEVIFSINSDGATTQTWGGMAFIIHSTVGGDMPAAYSGVDGGWGGNRTTKSFVSLFPDATGTDKRGMFFTEGQNLEIEDIFNFRDGYALQKFRNVTSTGVKGSNESFPDTDFPMFRLGDVYLMYAEAVLRGGTGGDAATSLGYVNQLRARAYGDNSGNIGAGDLTLNFILDERARELYWECHRRTDLIRYGKLTGDAYLWPWKGAEAAGKTVDAKYNVFPIPASDLNANPNLSNIEGY